MAIGSLVGGVAKLAGGISQRKAYRRESAEISRVGKQEEAEFREQGEQFKGEQRSALGAAGAEVSTGSPFQLMQETSRKVEEDAMKIRRETSFKARQARKAGGAALAQGIMGMGSSLLTATSDVYKFRGGNRR
jgi:hypothetical protein